jgi:hypothetical protein
MSNPLGRAARVGVVLILAAGLTVEWVGSAGAVGPPVLKGSITGSVKAGGHITFSLNVVQPGGWQNLQKLQVILLLHSIILDEIDWDQKGSTVATPSTFPVDVGSSALITGTFFKLTGRDVRTTSQGTHLTMTIRAVMVQDAPRGAVFNLGAIDDFLGITRITRPVQVPEAANGGFSWGALAAAVLGALFLGGFVGNLFSSRRRPAPTTSVYATIRRRLDETREKV